MRYVILMISLLSLNVQATVHCDVSLGDAVGGKKVSHSVDIEQDDLVEFKGETLLATVQYINGMLVQMMIEDTVNYSFAQIDQNTLIEQGKGNFTFQNHKNDGEYLSMSCEVVK